MTQFNQKPLHTNMVQGWRLVFLCPKCGETPVRRRSSTKSSAYWQCDKCKARWKEDPDVGKGRASAARLANACVALATAMIWYLMSQIHQP